MDGGSGEQTAVPAQPVRGRVAFRELFYFSEPHLQIDGSEAEVLDFRQVPPPLAWPRSSM